MSLADVVVKWGADTAEFDRGSSGVRQRAHVDAEYFAREWEKASFKTRERMFGFKNVAVSAFAGVTASIAIATKGALEFAKVHEPTQRALEHLKQSATETYQQIGANAKDAFAILDWGLSVVRGYENFWTDVFQGGGPSIASVVKEAKALNDEIERRARFRAEGLGAAEYLPDSFDKADVLRRRYQDQMKVVQDETEMRKSQAKTRAEREDADRYYQGESIRLYAPVKAVYDRILATRKLDQAEQDRRAKEMEDASRTQRQEQDDRDRQARDDADFLRTVQRESQISILRATGRQEEADAAEIRLDAEQKVAEVWDRQNASLDEQLAATMAIVEARDARLNAPRRRESVSGSIEAGMGAGEGFRAQVFGGVGANYDKTTDIAQSSLKALEQIRDNTARNIIGVFSP